VPDLRWLGAGRTYYWRVKARDSGGRWGDYSATWSFDIADTPNAGLAIAAPAVAAVGSPVTLTAQATGGSNILYTWQLGDGRQANGAAITHTYAAPGVYTVTLTAANPLGTDATARALQVDVPPAGLTIVAPEVNTAGLPLTLQAQMAAGTNLTYSWAMGDGTSLTGPAVVHTYPAAGVYSVTVTAANALAIISATVSLQVDTPIVDLTLTAPPLVAVGQPISLTAQVAAGSHAVYRWDFGDGTYAIGPAAEHVYQAPGIYALAVTASNPLGFLSAGSQVRVEEFIVTDHLWLPIIGAP
jgi:PKD repeat protein